MTDRAPWWSTACLDWEERIIAGRPLIPFGPLFPSEAEAALAIFNALKIVDAPGSPRMGDVCRDWLKDFVGSIFGAYDAESGRRLIQHFLLLVAKKNSKSTTASAIMVTALIRNWRLSGEFYILAPTKEVADNSFLPARDMIAADPDLDALLHVAHNQRTITHRNTDAFLRVVAADSETVSGKKTIGILIDELWLFGKRGNAEGMIREAIGGLASRPEGFVIYASTQSDTPPSGIFEQKLREFRAIRDGKVVDPGSLPVLYEFPRHLIDSGAYKERRHFYIPNPNLGASVNEAFLIDELARAERAGQASVVNFVAKHLNVQVSMALRSDGWAGAAIWEQGIEVGLTLDDILARSEVITIGVDGGGLDDLLGVAIIGRERGTKKWLGWAHALLSTVGAYRRKANATDYLRFRGAGELTVFRFGHVAEPAADEDEALTQLLAGVAPAPPASDNAQPVDIKFVVDLVQRIRDLGLLAQVGVDAAGIGAIVDALAEIEVTQDGDSLDAVRQGIGLMGAIKTIERKLADGSFGHGGQSLLAWCASNLKVVLTATAMRVARDDAGFGKVDPIMALFNAAHLMALNPEAEGQSIYDTMGAVPLQPAEPEIDEAILGNPRHPRWKEMRDRWERKHLSDEEAVY